jgi:hypothetical protein
LAKETAVAALLLTQRQDGNPNGQGSEVEILDSRGRPLLKAQLPRNAVAHRLPLPPGTRLTGFTLRILSSHAGPYGCVAEVDVELP